LTASDAERVETAFHDRLAIILNEPARGSGVHESDPPVRRPGRKKQRRSTVDKSVLALPTPRRIRDRDHVKSVAEQPCLVCGRRPADAHHLRFAQSPALGRKVSDEFTVPLCRGHHREMHRCGDEAAWWKKTGIDPTAAARVLWLKHSDRNVKADNTVEFARCFLRLANLPNFALDRLSRYEATLWRQVGRILFALDALDRRKPQERRRDYYVGGPQSLL
jgi:hypothetical protein